MNREKFNLTWYTYNDHLREMLHDMMTASEMTDVTIVSEDKKQFKAHKVVLSACSPVFKSILSDSHLPNPSIFLRGIQSLELESILQFIYLGKATSYQDRMKEFFNVAKSLEIKEISKGSYNNEEIENSEFEQNNKLLESDSEPRHIENNVVIKQRPIKINHTATAMTKQNSAFCDQCNKEFYDRSTLSKHVRSVHEGVKYPCVQCNHKATTSSHLLQHIRAIHEGIKYPCDQCIYTATSSTSLLQHIRAVHEGVKYPCDQCNYKATASNSLLRHIRLIHDGIKYPCNQCKYTTTSQLSLNKHVTLVHLS